MKKFLTISIIAALSLYAQTFNVSNTSEFRKALQDAANNGEDDTIVLASGTYKTTDDKEGTFKYSSTQENNLTIIGSDYNSTILSGDNQNQILNFISTYPNSKANLILKHIVFIDGNSSDDGGAVYSNSNLKVEECNFTNNNVSLFSNGGGFYCVKDAVVIDSIFNQNIAGRGGGFDAYNVIVTNSTFENNSAGLGGGFGAYDATVKNSIFKNNSANDGGGFNVAGNTTVIDSYFDQNNAHNTGGGFDSKNAIVTNSVFENNSAELEGGGFISEDVTVTNCVFENNNAADIGGGFASSNTTVINSIFKNNSADGGGGFTSSNTTVINSIFKNNNATGYGGGFYSHDNTIVMNSLFIANTKNIFLGYGNDNKIYNSIFKDNKEYDIIWNAIDAIPHLYNNYINITIDKLKEVSKNNIFDGVNLGFKDPEHDNYELTALSDLIDKGTIDVNKTIIPETDLAGNARIVGKSIDIGPYEYQGDKISIQVKAGWNMINIPTKIKELSNIDAIIVWKWNNSNKKWEAYSKDESLLNEISNYADILHVLDSGDGVWINEDEAKTLTFNNPVIVVINWDNLKKGWNLKGTGKDIELYKVPSKVKIIWYWDNPNKKWMVYSGDEKINNVLQSYYSKGEFEKLNKLEANKAYWFFVE